MKKSRKSNPNGLPSSLTKQQPRESNDGAAFLIPAAQEKHQEAKHEPLDSRQRNSELVTTRKLKSSKLTPVSSHFYHLPIIHPSQPVSIHPYITFQATYPTSQTKAPSGPSPPTNLLELAPSSSLDSQGRTAFLTNLPRSITPGSLARLFAQALHISPGSIEVSIREPEFHKNALSPSELNLFQRDLQVFHATRQAQDNQSTATKKYDALNPGSNPQPKKKQIRLFESKLDDECLARKLWPRRLVLGAHVRFKTSEEIVKLKNLSDLPIEWPLKCPKKECGEGWMAIYEMRRRMTRLPLQRAYDYADLWSQAWDSGQIPSLLQEEADLLDQPAAQRLADEQDSEDGCAWTMVGRGGHHGRSTIIPTQSSSLPTRGPDPYAQSSMADRDQNAAVKVMNKRFAKNFASSSSDQQTTDSKGSKRKGSQLNPHFYRSNASMINKSKKFRLDQIRDGFNQDKSKLRRVSN